MKKFFYRVQNGDTVLNVSQRFNAPTINLIADNNLKEEISVGDILYICAYDNAYTVTAIDSLKGLSRKFGIDEQEILSHNNVPYIFYGLTIKIPQKSSFNEFNTLGKEF